MLENLLVPGAAGELDDREGLERVTTTVNGYDYPHRLIVCSTFYASPFVYL